jgi:hypothetical protein
MDFFGGKFGHEVACVVDVPRAAGCVWNVWTIGVFAGLEALFLLLSNGRESSSVVMECAELCACWKNAVGLVVKGL